MAADEDLLRSLQFSIDTLSSTVVSLKTDVNDLRSEVTGMRTEIGDLRKVITDRNEYIKKLEHRIMRLEDQNDDLEQYSCRNSLRITGFTEPSDETHNGLENRVMTLINDKLQVPIVIQDVDRMHRVGSKVPRKDRSVIVKFASYRSRDMVFKAKGVLRPGGRSSHRPWNLGTAAGITGADPTAFPPLSGDAAAQPPNGDAAAQPPNGDAAATGTNTTPPAPDPDQNASDDYKNIFINEDLTRNRQFLLFQCRNARKKGDVKEAWSHDGKILIKDLMGRIRVIRNQSDLDDCIPTPENTAPSS